MIQYLKFVIKQSLYEDISELSFFSLYDKLITSKNIIDDNAFMKILNIDVNHVAVKKNMHKHNVICHKYEHKKCRFNFLKSLQFQSQADEHEVIHLKKNHSYVNAFNSVIESCFRFNHDIQ